MHVATTVYFSAVTWSEIDSIFVDHGQNLWTKYVVYISPGTVTSTGAGTVGAICSILADSTMVCLTPLRVLYYNLQSVDLALLAGLGTAVAGYSASCHFSHFLNWYDPNDLLLVDLSSNVCAVFKIIGTYKGYINPYGSIFGYVIYTSFMLASTLWCTLLIIYRIVTIARTGGGLRDYHHILEVLVELSALYSISLILCIAFLTRNDISLVYFDTLATVARVKSHSFSVFTSNKHHTGSCSDTLCWACRSRSHSPRQLLTGQCNIRLTSLPE